MTEQRFQAPPIPPRAPSFGGAQPAQPTAQPQAQSSAAAPVENKAELPADNFAASFRLPVTIYKTKVLGGILAATAVVGILFGALLFGGSSDATPKAQGLAGVVPNRDVKDLTRCGMVPETVACVAYFVNHTRNDKLAEEFFDEAVHQTGRAKYRINIDNPHYAKTRIPPGYIAQIRIPTLN